MSIATGPRTPRHARGVRVWAPVLLALAAAACPGSKGSPAVPSPPGAELLHDLSAATVHDGWAPDPHVLWLVGERIGAGGGILLRSEDGGASLRVAATFAEAAHLRAILFDENGAGWIAGDAVDGTGLLLTSAGGVAWTRVGLPAGVSDVASIASAGGTLVLAGAAGDSAVVLTREGTGWREATLGPVGRRFARLESVAASGATVAVAGTDGSRAVVLASDDAARTFSLDAHVPRLTGALAVSMTGTTLWVGGYAGTNDATKAGVLVRRRDGAAGWERRRLPGPSVNVNDVTFADERRGAVAVATGIEDRVYLTSDGGDSWRIMALPGGSPATIERLVLSPDGVLYAIGASGLYRRRL